MATKQKIKQSSSLLLLFGYARDESTNLTVIPDDIMSSICLKYYLQTMDYFRPHGDAFIDHIDNTFGVKQRTHITNCISQIGWSSGKHKMSIKILSHSYFSHGLSIGVLANKDVKTDQWAFDVGQAKLSYQFYFACRDDNASSGIYRFKNGDSKCTEIVQSGDIHNDESDDVMNGEEVSMCIDCNDWTLQFYYKESKVGKQVCIEKDTTYYAAIVYNTYPSSGTGVSAKYQLLVHTLPFQALPSTFS